jgi:hypothetical protein
LGCGFLPNDQKKPSAQVLKNHHIPNCIPGWASLQLFTLKEPASWSASARASKDAAKACATLGMG